jgi:hypothetical protein
LQHSGSGGVSNAVDCVKAQGLVEDVSTTISNVSTLPSIRLYLSHRRRSTRCINVPGQEICTERHYHQRRCAYQTQALLSGEAEIVGIRPNLRIRVARIEYMLERLVQVDPSGEAEVLSGSDLPIPGRRGSGASQRKSMHDVKLRDELSGTHMNVTSPLSSLSDHELRGRILSRTPPR